MSTTMYYQYAGISGLGFGINKSLGLFLKPISEERCFGREELSLAIAASMLLNGVTSIFWVL